MSTQNPLVLMILQTLENICQQSYLAQATTGVPSLSYPQYRLKFLREVVGILTIEANALEQRLGSQQVAPETSVQQPDTEAEPNIEQEHELEPEPVVETVRPVAITVTKEQQPITQEQANALKQELAQLESDIENRKSTLSQSALAMLEARREEIKAQLNSPIVSSQQSQTQQPVSQQQPEPKLGLFESRRLKNLQSDLKRVQGAYAKRQLDKDFTPEIDQKYQARIQQLQAEIDKILKKTA